MWCFHRNFAQIDPPLLCQTGTVEHFLRTIFLSSVSLHCQNELKNAQAFLVSVLTPLKQEITHLFEEKQCSKPSGQAFTLVDNSWCRFGSWSFAIKLNFCSDFEHKVWSRFWNWISGQILLILLLMFGWVQDSEARSGRDLKFKFSWDTDVWLRFWT